MSREPWTKDDDEFRLHCIFCQICDNNGFPTGSAYRPHTLDSDCWCTHTPSGKRKRRECHLAIEYGMLPMTASAGLDGRIAQTELAMRITGIQLDDGELRAAYQSAIADIRRDIRATQERFSCA